MKENAVCCGAAFKDEMACSVCERHYVRDMDKKSAICMYLKNSHTGKSRAIHSRDLQRLFSIDGRNLRRKISALRQDGYPICSDETGYFYADNQQEINQTVFRLNGLLTKVSNARTGLLHASIQPTPITIEITVLMNGGDTDGNE